MITVKCVCYEECLLCDCSKTEKYFRTLTHLDEDQVAWCFEQSDLVDGYNSYEEETDRQLARTVLSAIKQRLK